MLPASYHDYTRVKDLLPFDTLYPTPKACYALTVISTTKKVTPSRLGGSTTPRISFDVTDDCVEARLTAFGETWMWESLNLAKELLLMG